MAYIGKQPVVGNFQVCDAISVVNGQAAYTMQVASANVEPENANHMLVSLNGVLQKPGSSFTISGATITFASNLVTNDVIDFIILLGDTLNVGTPSDDTVGAAQIKADLISGTTALTSAPDDTDEFLVSDAGTLKRIDYSLIKGGGITMADQFRLTANLSSDADPISSNLERVDDATFSKIGTGMTLSSGVYTFPSTGLYYVVMNARVNHTSGDTIVISMNVSSDSGSNYDTVSEISFYQTADDHLGTNNAFVNVTNASTFRIKFTAGSFTSASINGNTNLNKTSFTFIRLGDSQ